MSEYTHRTACRKCGCYLLGPVEWRCHCKEPQAHDAWAEIRLPTPEKGNGGTVGRVIAEPTRVDRTNEENEMEEPLGYNLLNADKGVWFGVDGDWQRSYNKAFEFEALEHANAEMLRVQQLHKDDTFYVLACMGSPA